MRYRKNFRRKRMKSDVVPISLCREQVSIPQSSSWTCQVPAGYLYPLADGGALDAALRAASPGNELLTQGISKGLLWGGGAFNAHWSYVGDPTAMLPGPLQSIIGIWQAIVLLETNYDSVTAIRSPGFLPNIVAPDEEQNGDILHRWYDRLIIASPGVGGPSPAIFATDNSGMASLVYCYDEATNCFGQVGTGCNTLRRQIVKTKRRLKENQAIYYCVNIVPGFIPSAGYNLGFDLYGYQAIRQLR